MVYSTGVGMTTYAIIIIHNKFIMYNYNFYLFSFNCSLFQLLNLHQIGHDRLVSADTTIIINPRKFLANNNYSCQK